MLILVTGGAASGKSEHAERLVCEKAQSRLYLATMQPFGKSAEARIARHRALRAGKGFATVERTLDLANLRLSQQYDGILLEDLGNLLANELFESVESLIRLDMSEYMEKFSVQRLIGAPPGYVGYDEGGQLTEAVRRRPYSVILLDEMEKAHPDVFNVLLQVLDDGRLTDGQGRQVSFKNTIIIMTSNVGSKAIADLSGKDEEEMRHQVDAAMAQTFRPEFLNRIDDIVVFHPLGMAQIEKIVDIQLADVRARLAKERMTLAITPAAKQMLAVGGLDPVFGARPLKRLVQREVVDAIAAAIIDGTVREGDQVTVDADKDGGFTVVCDNTPAATYEVPDAE